MRGSLSPTHINVKDGEDEVGKRFYPDVEITANEKMLLVCAIAALLLIFIASWSLITAILLLVALVAGWRMSRQWRERRDA